MAPEADYEIAEATEADLDGIVETFVTVSAEGRWISSEPPIDREVRRARFLTTIENPETLFLVARENGSVVGYLVLTSSWPSVLDLGMAIGPQSRGRGVGSALMRRAIEWARSQDVHKIALHVYPHNAAAIALYEKHGFVREGLFRKHQRRKSGELWDTIPMGLLL